MVIISDVRNFLSGMKCEDLNYWKVQLLKSMHRFVHTVCCKNSKYNPDSIQTERSFWAPIDFWRPPSQTAAHFCPIHATHTHGLHTQPLLTRAYYVNKRADTGGRNSKSENVLQIWVGLGQTPFEKRSCGIGFKEVLQSLWLNCLVIEFNML